MSPAASQCAKKAKVERVISVAGLSAFGITSAPALASIPKPRREMSPKVTKTNMATQRKALRALRKDFQKRKADLRTIVKNRKTAMTRIRADIKNLEEEIKTANEELSVEFDSGSSCFSSSDSESSSSSSKAPVKEAVPSSKGKPQAAQGAVPSPKGTLQEEGKRKRRRRLPFLVPGAPAPDHQGWPNSEGVYYPGFVQDDPRYCEACEQLRRGFRSATRAHRPKDMPCAWAPLAKGS